MSYTGRGGHYWDKSSNAVVSRGEYYLTGSHPCEFGEPACIIGTGVIREIPFNKIPIKSYDADAGAEETIGVFITWKDAILGVTDEELALTGSHHRIRDTAIFQKGAISIKNVGTTDIAVNKTVIPANGGCEKATATGQHTLGKSMQKIPAGKRGLVFVDPEYQELNL